MPLLFLLLLFLFTSCRSVPEENPAFPVVNLAVLDDGNVVSPVSAQIIQSPLDFAENSKLFFEQSAIKKNIVLSIYSHYDFYGKPQMVQYYVLLYGLSKIEPDFAVPDKKKTKKKKINPAENEIVSMAKGDVLGEAGKNGVKMVIFSKSEDQFLAINSGSRGVPWAGFFWYDASFLFPRATPDWLSFKQTDDIAPEVMQIKEKGASKLPGAVFYPNIKLRFKTALDEYPREATPAEKERLSGYERLFYGKTEVTKFVSALPMADESDFVLVLCWQSDFDSYLKNEYELGTDIWLFGNIIAYDFWNHCAYFFVRDFRTSGIETLGSSGASW